MRMSCPYGSSVVLREARSTSLTAAADIPDLEIRWKCHLDIGWLTRSRGTLTRAALCPGPHGEASGTSAVFLHNLGGTGRETVARWSAPLQPVLRIDRLATAADLEVQRGLVVSAGIADRSDHVTRGHGLADLAEELFVVPVQAHVTFAVVEHDHQPHARQPVCVHDAPRKRRANPRTPIGAHQHALPAQRSTGARLTEPRQHLPRLHRPGQLAAQALERGLLCDRHVLERLAQLGDQLLERARLVLQA